MKYNMQDVCSSLALAQSMTNGMADGKLCLWVPELRNYEEEMDFLVARNVGTAIVAEKFEEVYQFRAEYMPIGKCSYALSQDGKTALAGYASKKGVICYDCESGQMLWNNPNIKRIDRIRFNDFDSDIIEVINTKLEIKYLDKKTGQILDAEKAKQVRQILKWVRSSKNGKYLITMDSFSSKDKGIYTVYDTETKSILGRFVAQKNMGNFNFDITNDGQFAVCSSYQMQGISLINVPTGEVIWTRNSITNIGRVYFDKEDKKVVVGCGCMYGGVYLLNIQNGETDAHKSIEQMNLNMFGADIEFPKRKYAQIGNKQVESPTFDFTKAVGTPKGVILVPAGEGLILCDNDGNTIWENMDIHVDNVVYQEEKNTICGFVNYGDEVKIVIISMETGEVISSLEINKFDPPRAFINNNRTLVCCTGKMYDISQENITEKEEIFECFVG